MINDIEVLGIKKEEFPYRVGSWALPELGTNFTIQMLEELKPKNMTEMIYFAGLSHGTSVWAANGQDLMNAGKTIDQIISTRDRLYDYLVECGLTKERAFFAVDKIRKGAWNKVDEDIKKEIDEKVPSWYVDSMKKISYLFPSAHAASYMQAAVRIAYFKLYYPVEYYTAILTRYGAKNNVANFPYDAAVNVSSLEQYEAIVKNIKENSTRPEQEKDGIRLALIIYEAKLRGITLSPATLNSHYRFFAINPEDRNNIIRPLTSIAGVGEGLANKIYNDISVNGVANIDELYERTMIVFDEETGKTSLRKIYTDSVLLKLGLPVPEELSEEEKALAKKYKIAISKFSKIYVRNKIKEYQLNPPYEITEKDKALQKLIKIKLSDFETTKDFKQKLDEEIELICSIDTKIALKVQKINEKYDNSPE